MPGKRFSGLIGIKRCARTFKWTRGHAGGNGPANVERQIDDCFAERVESRHSGDIRKLMRIGNDRARPMRKHCPRELRGPEMGALDMDVGVDERGRNHHAGGVDRFRRLPVVADAGDDAVDNRDIGGNQLAGKDVRHQPVGNDRDPPVAVVAPPPIGVASARYRRSNWSRRSTGPCRSLPSRLSRDLPLDEFEKLIQLGDVLAHEEPDMFAPHRLAAGR